MSEKESKELSTENLLEQASLLLVPWIEQDLSNFDSMEYYKVMRRIDRNLNRMLKELEITEKKKDSAIMVSPKFADACMDMKNAMDAQSISGNFELEHKIAVKLYDKIDIHYGDIIKKVEAQK